VAIVASITSIRNWYAYDDVSLILFNPAAHSLSALVRVWGQPYWPPGVGGLLYRPLTSAFWALEWVAGGGSALVFHVVNILLYAAVSASVYALARRLVSRGAAIVAALLFAVHPVHVEVVANCVGQSELFAALAVITATMLYLDGPGDARRRWAIALLYAAGLLAKENAVVLPALLAAAEVTVVRDDRPWRVRLEALRPLAVAMAVALVGCLALRYAVIGTVLGDTPDPVFARTTFMMRLWTMLGVVVEWGRLLAWPVRLSISYNPPAVPIRTGLDRVAGVGALIVIVVGCLAAVARRRAPAVTFGLAWTGIALLPVSNVLFVSGVLMTERSLFLPSVGAALAIGGAVSLVGDRPVARVLVRVVAGVLIVAGTLRSAVRQPVWHDDHTLFSTAVSDAPLDYHAHYLWADQLFAEGKADEGKAEARRSVELSGGYPPALALLAAAYAKDGDCSHAIPLWRRALGVMPWLVPPRIGLVTCLVQTGQGADARAVASEGLAHGETDPTLRRVAGGSGIRP
jgi:protein O-mannosyl-transferase